MSLGCFKNLPDARFRHAQNVLELDEVLQFRFLHRMQSAESNANPAILIADLMRCSQEPGSVLNSPSALPVQPAAHEAAAAAYADRTNAPE